jgi:hypothetical protein
MHNPMSYILLQGLCKHALDKLVKAAAYLGEPFDKENPAGVLQTVHTMSQVILKSLSEIKVCGFLLLQVRCIADAYVAAHTSSRNCQRSY